MTDTSSKPVGNSAAHAGGAISLQILAPHGNGANGGGATSSAGGPMGEWSRRLTSFGCVAGFSLILIGAAAAVAAGALYYVYGEDSTLDCVGHLESISFSYVSWLRWMGLTFLGGLVLEIFLIATHGWFGTVCTSKAASIFGMIFYAFQFAWAVVGAILYWTTVADNCPNGSTIQAFALAMFIIESVVAVCLFLGREAVNAA